MTRETGRTKTMAPLVLRLGFAFFFIYLSVVTGAMLWPRVFDGIMGLVELRWPATPSREFHLLANISLCGLVPTAFMAARTAVLGEWTLANRAFFLCMLGANIAINAWSIVVQPAMVRVLAGDFVLVFVLLALAIAIRPQPMEAA